MNKYAVMGILADAFDGKRIIIVERDGHQVRQALDEFRRFVSENDIPAKVRVANGAERIDLDLGDGCVVFATPRSNRMRGMSADVVFIDNDAHRVLEGDGPHDPRVYDRFRENIAVALNSRNGRVVHS